MDAVCAADDGGVLELKSATLESLGDRDDAGANEGGGFFDLECLSGIDDVCGSEAVVEPPGMLGVGDVLGYRRSEGDDVMLDLGFDGIDTVDGEVTAVADGVGGGLRHDPKFGQGLGGGSFNLEPAAIFVFV